MLSLNLAWVKCEQDRWCNLEAVDLSRVETTGIYIIWHGGPDPHIVRIGQGDIAYRLTAQRKDKAILAYREKGGLYVTWAAVAAHRLDGVENYLSDLWRPLIGERFPNEEPIAVNSPWG